MTSVSAEMHRGERLRMPLVLDRAAWLERLCASGSGRVAHLGCADSPYTRELLEAGLLVGIGGKLVYHLGDTCLFSDLQLISQPDQIDIALMCIGGHYTMDRIDGVRAAGLIGAQTVIPCHYGTFPPIETDAQAFKSDVESSTQSSVVVLDPGDTHSA